MKICTVDEMCALMQRAEQQFCLSAEIVMEHVGMAAQLILAEEIGLADTRFVVLCGSGMKAGYGCAVARQLYACGAYVCLYFLEKPEECCEVVRQQLDRLRCLQIEMERITSTDAPTIAVLHSDAVVDALLDINVSDDVSGLAAELIAMVNDSRRPILSLDLPSGIHADTGNVLGTAIRATYTLMCGVPKVGNLLYPGFERCGKLTLARLSFPPELLHTDSVRLALNHPPQLPARSATGHKGTFGDALVIAGAGAYYGAPYFSAAAVLKAGGGYARLAAPASIIPVIATKASELVFVPQQETESGSLAFRNSAPLLELADKVDMVIVGPGLSLHEETQQLVRELAAAIRKPLLIDGDGITAICRQKSLLHRRSAETILTPHLGEMSRLTGKAVHDINADPIAVLRQTSRELDAYIVLKGAHSLIGYPDGRVFVNMSGNSGMGTAGSGDVLTGTIAAMFGLGLPIPDAVRKGVFLHGLSGDLAARQKGEDGITAQDILDTLPTAVRLDRQTLPQEFRQRYLL